MMIPEDIDRAEKNMSRYAKQHHILTVMANYASDTGGYSTAGRSAIWDETGSHVAQAGVQGECLVLASGNANDWAGRVLSVSVD